MRTDPLNYAYELLRLPVTGEPQTAIGLTTPSSRKGSVFPKCMGVPEGRILWGE